MSTCQKDYDVCVVGSGLIGSAAAHHLVENNPSLRVALIGPDEPQGTNKTNIYGAWYDQGRITSVLNLNQTWVLLTQRSISNYRHLEEKSGIRFYEEVGYLVFGSSELTMVSELKGRTSLTSHHVKQLSTADLNARFPYLKTKPGDMGLYSEHDSGYINPRELVAAQQHVGHLLGCDIISDIVEEITELESVGWCLNLQSGQSVSTQKVLVSVGAFSSSRPLLPGDIQPYMDLCGLTVLLVEVEPDDMSRYRHMPSMITYAPVQPKRGQQDTMCRCYILPPIKYPNGKFYLKIGHSKEMAVPLHTAAQVHQWYLSGSSQEAQKWLLHMSACLFPDLNMQNYKFDRCVIAHTLTGQLYVDMIAQGYGVAMGGCGCSAMCSDEIGHMAARMIVMGEWDYDLPAQLFHFQSQPLKSKM